MNKEDIANHYKIKHATDSQFSKGTALIKHLPEIVEIFNHHKCRSVLDYGCGKAIWWKSKFWKPLFNSEPKLGLYDPYVEEYQERPTGRYDLVICTDVLEHVPEEDIKELLTTLIKLTRRVLFLNISTVPANKKFDDGTNLHITIKSEKEWEKLIHNLRLDLEQKYKTTYTIVTRFDEQVGR